MTSYVALLRGINVGGHNKIKMNDLRDLLMQLGLHQVKTYIQSGNLLFLSDETAVKLETKIETAIQSKYGFQVTVVIRTVQEFVEIVSNCPYQAESLKEEESIHFVFLAVLPSQDNINKLKSVDSDVDEFVFLNKTIYMYLKQSIRHSKLASQVSKLGVPSTVRNWNTVNKLVNLSETFDA